MHRRLPIVGITIATLLGLFLIQFRYRGFLLGFFMDSQNDESTVVESNLHNVIHGAPPVEQKSDVLLLAYYYAWYTQSEGNWSSHFSTQGVFPSLGLYGSDRVQIAEQHNEWAQRAGIDAWVVSWVKEDPNSNFRKGMLQSSNFHKMKYCLLLESREFLPTKDFADSRALDAFVDAMILMRDNHFNHPSYLHVNGRPVVALYITRTWINFQPYMVDTVRKKVGVDIFFIADEPWFNSQVDPFAAKHGIKNGKQVFDAYTAYNMYTEPDTYDGQTAVDYMMSPKVTNVLQQWSNSTVYFPNILPKYHHFRPLGSPLIGNTSGFRTQLDAFACLPRPADFVEGSIPNIMFITSWNEWWEGSQIEPDDGSGGYNFSFIDELRDFKDTGVQCPHKASGKSTDGASLTATKSKNIRRKS